MPTFRVEMTATKVVEVTVSEADLEHGETELEQGAETLAIEWAFRIGGDERVKVVEEWDLTVESVTQD